MRRRLSAEGTSDEELLLRWIVGKEDIDAMRANPRPLEYLNSEQPLVNLLQELSKRTQNRQIHVQTPAFSLTLEKRGSAVTFVVSRLSLVSSRTSELYGRA